MNTCDKIDESEKMAENNEIQELIKKAVTSKSLEVLTEAEAQKLVDSQTCRPGMVSFFSFILDGWTSKDLMPHFQVR